MGTNVSTNYITCPADANKTLGIKLPFLVMIIKNVNLVLICNCVEISWRNTLPLKFKCLMIKMWDVGSEHPTIKALLESSHLSVLCLWGWMRAGTRSSSTCLISQEEPTEPTISKLSGKSSYFVNQHLFFRVQLHANCRMRRIYFSDRLYTEDELPPEFKLFLPVAGKT